MSKEVGWVASVKKLYFVSLIAWGIGVAVLLGGSLLQLVLQPGYWDFPVMALVTMSAALPGLLFFYLLSKRMDESDLAASGVLFERIMRLQTPTGIVALIGGVLGALPFLVNVLGVFTLSVGDGAFLMNLGLIVPWISLYGFIATYLIAVSLNKKRKQTQ